MILITGASSGIGQACAEAFAKQSKDLILVARRSDRLAALKTELEKKHGVSVHTFALDVRDRNAVARLGDDNKQLFSRIEVLVNNAGLAKGGMAPVHEGEPDDWDAMIDTNVKGLLYVSRAVLPFMLAKSRGHIVNLGSVAGRWVYPNGAVYCSTKYAVRALNEGLRMDLHGSGIRVTTVDPGMVETEFSEVRFGGDQARAKAVYQGVTPLSPADVADAVVWAASRPAHVNIQEIVMYPTDQAAPGMVKRRT